MPDSIANQEGVQIEGYKRQCDPRGVEIYDENPNVKRGWEAVRCGGLLKEWREQPRTLQMRARHYTALEINIIYQSEVLVDITSIKTNGDTPYQGSKANIGESISVMIGVGKSTNPHLHISHPFISSFLLSMDDFIDLYLKSTVFTTKALEKCSAKPTTKTS